MKNIFIEYPKCSTCKKAKKWLEEKNVEFISRNIVEETPTIEELTEWIKSNELDIKKWFNTSGLKYKELNLKEKLPNMSDEEKIKLLASDGMLIKRPLLIIIFQSLHFCFVPHIYYSVKVLYYLNFQFLILSNAAVVLSFLSAVAKLRLKNDTSKVPAVPEHFGKSFINALTFFINAALSIDSLFI